MSDQNYSPPQATLDTQPAKPASALRIAGAVLLAFAVDVVGTNVLESALGYGFIAVMGGGAVDGGLLARYQHDMFSYDNPWGVAMFVIGAAMSIIGGQICARRARGREWRALGWLCVVHLLYSVSRGSPVDWGWWEGNAVTMSSVLLGFGLRMRGLQNARLRQQATADPQS